MTAPYVIAHWQVSEELRDAAAPMKTDGTERAAIYLTNALTGWHASAAPTLPGFEALVEERDQASAVKRDKPIIVVLGNPPYNAFAGTSPEEEEGLVEPYKEGLQAPPWRVKKFNLDDLYVRFFRVAERRIGATGTGIVCFISNASWITERSFVVMRKSLTTTFDQSWIENMHGNRKISERGPDGKTSQTIFAMKGLSPGIKVGVAVTLLARTTKDDRIYRYRDDINASLAADRRAQLLETLNEPDFESHYEQVQPTEARWYRLAPGEAKEEYALWPSVADLADVEPINGLMEKRGGALIDADRSALEARMKVYFDPVIDDPGAAKVVPGLLTNHARFDPSRTRKRIQEGEGFVEKNIQPYLLRPFDLAWAYASGFRPLWNEPRPRLLHMLPDAEGFIATRRAGVANPEGWPVFWTTRLGDDHALRADAYYFPIVENLSGAPRPNLSSLSKAYLEGIGLSPDIVAAHLLWMHVLAISYAPAWLSQHSDGIRYDWPRVPVPDDAKQLQHSAELGRKLAALLDPDQPLAGVTSSAIQPELVKVAELATLDGKPDLKVVGRWGVLDGVGRVNPGPGKTEIRPYLPEESATAEHAPVLGDATRDVFLNDNTYWKNVPERIWATHIGGYQVLKKWLSYRELGVLGRALTPQEVDHVTKTCRRLSALCLLGAELDENYADCAAASLELIPDEEEPLEPA